MIKRLIKRETDDELVAVSLKTRLGRCWAAQDHRQRGIAESPHWSLKQEESARRWQHERHRR